MKAGATIAIGVALMAGSADAQQAPNPAAAFCVEDGGRYEVVRGADGDRGVCVFSDGQRVDAWAHFRSSRSGETPAQRLANPAAIFCVERGGAYRIVRDASGSERGACILSDGREVDAWEYFREHHS